MLNYHDQKTIKESNNVYTSYQKDGKLSLAELMAILANHFKGLFKR